MLLWSNILVLLTCLGELEALAQSAGPHRVVVQFRKNEEAAYQKDQWIAITRNAERVVIPGATERLESGRVARLVWSRVSDGVSRDLVAYQLLSRTNLTAESESLEKDLKHAAGPRGELIVNSVQFNDSKALYTLESVTPLGQKRVVKRVKLLVLDDHVVGRADRQAVVVKLGVETNFSCAIRMASWSDNIKSYANWSMFYEWTLIEKNETTVLIKNGRAVDDTKTFYSEIVNASRNDGLYEETITLKLERAELSSRRFQLSCFLNVNNYYDPKEGSIVTKSGRIDSLRHSWDLEVDFEPYVDPKVKNEYQLAANQTVLIECPIKFNAKVANKSLVWLQEIQLNESTAYRRIVESHRADHRLSLTPDCSYSRLVYLCKMGALESKLSLDIIDCPPQVQFLNYVHSKPESAASKDHQAPTPVVESSDLLKPTMMILVFNGLLIALVVFVRQIKVTLRKTHRSLLDSYNHEFIIEELFVRSPETEEQPNTALDPEQPTSKSS